MVLPEPDRGTHRREALHKKNPGNHQGHRLQGCLCGGELRRTANRHHRRDREGRSRHREKDSHRAYRGERLRQTVASHPESRQEKIHND